jgi:hypothetical protein
MSASTHIDLEAHDIGFLDVDGRELGISPSGFGGWRIDTVGQTRTLTAEQLRELTVFLLYQLGSYTPIEHPKAWDNLEQFVIGISGWRDFQARAPNASRELVARMGRLVQEYPELEP